MREKNAKRRDLSSKRGIVMARPIMKLKDGTTFGMRYQKIFLSRDKRKGTLADGREVKLLFGKWIYEPQ